MDDSGNYNNVLVVEPSLMPGSPEEKQAHVRPLDEKDDLGEVHGTAWEVSAGADGQKATAAETGDGLKPLVPFRSIVIWLNRKTNCSHKLLTSLDEAEPTEPSTESYKHEASASAKPVADDSKPTSEPRANEPSPLFAHECLTPEHEEAEVYLHDPDQTGTGTVEEIRILDDCELEMFPTDREHILQRILTTKVSLDEDQTSADGIPSATSIPPQVVVESLPSSGQTSPQLSSIKEEDVPDTAVPPPLDVSEPVQPDQGRDASRQVPDSSDSEATEATGREDSPPSDHSSLSKVRGLPLDGHTQVLDPGLATLGTQHPAIEQHPNPQPKAQYASPGVDGAADLTLIDSITQKQHLPMSAISKSPVLSRRRSVPGSFEEPEENVDRVSHLQKKTVGKSPGTSGEADTIVDGSREGKDPGKRPVTANTIGFAPGLRYENLFQAFWRIIMVDWLGAILARFSWKSGDRK